MDRMADTYQAVEQVIKNSHSLQAMLKHANPALMIYGSVVNALCQESNSDLDLTLVVSDFELSHEVIVRELVKELQADERFQCN